MTLQLVHMQIGMTENSVVLAIDGCASIKVRVGDAHVEADIDFEGMTEKFSELATLTEDEDLFNAAGVSRLLGACRTQIREHPPTYHMINEYIRCFYVHGEAGCHKFATVLVEAISADGEIVKAGSSVIKGSLLDNDIDATGVSENKMQNVEKYAKSIGRAIRKDDGICIHCWTGESDHLCHDCGELDAPGSKINHSNCASAGMETPSNERRH